MQPLRLCVCLAFIAGISAYDLSQNLVEFYCVFNGNYSDKEQVEREGGNRPIITIKVQPILAPALSQIPVVYEEEVSDGKLVRASIVLFQDGKDGVIFANNYNFTGNANIRPGTFDTNRIKSFTKADLQGQPDCRDNFQRVQPFVFAGTYTDCKDGLVNGRRPYYACDFACGGYVGRAPEGATEKSTFIPYRMKLQGNSYPLENAPDNYICACDQPRK